MLEAEAADEDQAIQLPLASAGGLHRARRQHGQQQELFRHANILERMLTPPFDIYPQRFPDLVQEEVWSVKPSGDLVDRLWAIWVKLLAESNAIEHRGLEGVVQGDHE